MAITSLKGKLAWLLQSDRIGYRSRAGDRSGDLINYYPQGGRVLTHKALTHNVGPTIDQRQLDPEIGGSIYLTGAYRAGYALGGDFSIQPRLEDFAGWMLYALTGSILGEHINADGVHETAFYLPFGDAAGRLPWMTFFKYVPGLGPASDALEIYEDTRLINGAFSIPAAGLMTLNATARGRVFGITGEEKYIGRDTAVYTLWGLATGGTATTLVDSAQTWTDDEHIGSTVLVEHLNGDRELVVITDNTSDTLTVAGWTATPAAGAKYTILSTLADSGEATGGTATTLVDSTKTWVVDAYVDHMVYVEDTGDTLSIEADAVTTNTADTLTVGAFTHTPVAGDKYWVYTPGADGMVTLALGGNIRRVEVNNAVYNYAAANDWVFVPEKGTRRIEMKKALYDDEGVIHYYLYIDGEFFSEIETGDQVAILEQMTLDAGCTVRTLVDAELFTVDDEYNEWYVSVYDADGVAEGPIKVEDVDSATNTATLAKDLSQDPSGFSFAVYMPDTEIEWLPYECPFSIPISAEPNSVFRGFAEPFGGDPLPIREVTITLDYTALGSDQEKLIGAYEDDDVTIQQLTATLNYTYRVRNSNLWSNIATNRDISQIVNRFSPLVFKSDISVRTVSAAKIPGTEHPYGIEWMFPTVTWTPSGAVQLSGNNVVEMAFTGNVQEPCKVENPIGPEQTIAGDSNVLSGSVSGAFLSKPVLAAQRGVTVEEIEEWVPGRFIRVTGGTGAGQVRMVDRYIPSDGANPVGGTPEDTLVVASYDADTNTITVSSGISSDDEFNNKVLRIAGKGTVVVTDTVLGTLELVCSGRWDEEPAAGDSALIHSDSARILPSRVWITQLLANDSILALEDYYGVAVLTNSRESTYASDIPENP